MTDIPNTEYITINKDGIFVGGKRAKTYRGVRIDYMGDVRKLFADIQKINPNVAELHALSSKTCGQFAVPGYPSGEHGIYAWCRVKFNDGKTTSWVFRNAYAAAVTCAAYCAFVCAHCIRVDAVFCSVVLDTKNLEIEKLKKIDFAKLPNQTIVLNGYRIVVEKVAGHVK